MTKYLDGKAQPIKRRVWPYALGLVVMSVLTLAAIVLCYYNIITGHVWFHHDKDGHRAEGFAFLTLCLLVIGWGLSAGLWSERPKS